MSLLFAVRSVSVQHDGAGLLQVPLTALQQRLTVASGPQPQTEQLLHLEVVYGLRDAPAVSEQSRATLVQGHTVNLSMNLGDALLWQEAGVCVSSIIVVVGGVWFRSRRLLHHRSDGRHVGRAVSFEIRRSLWERGRRRALGAVNQRGKPPPVPADDRVQHGGGRVGARGGR